MDTTRTRIERELLHAADGLDVSALATRLGVHQNTIRWHLGALTELGQVSATPQPRPGRGRPRIVYRAEQQRRDGTRAEYRLLATVLSSAVSTPDAATTAGRAWGGYLLPKRPPTGRVSDEEATQAVADLLAEHGFEPQAGQLEVRMRRCPFHDLAQAQPEIVCAVHRGLIDGALEELGSDLRLEALDVFAEPGVCVARLATSGPSGPSSRAASAARA